MKNDDEENIGKTGCFFTADLTQIEEMIKLGANANYIMAYLVICRGVNNRHPKKISTHGANSIFNRVGMSYNIAEKAIQWLIYQKFIKKFQDISESLEVKSKSKRVKWILNECAYYDASKKITLSNSLIDGVGRGKANPPLHRLFHDIDIGSYGLQESRLDTIMLLLNLYQRQDFTYCAGVNPCSGIYREYKFATNLNGDSKIDIPDTNASLFEIKGGSSVVYHSFADNVLFYIDEKEERYKRFWDALRNLERLGIIYEVTQVWSSNPNLNKKDDAELLYSLYIHDYHARQSEPYLQRIIHTSAFKLGLMDAYSQFYDDEDKCDIRSGQFRYIAPTKNPGYVIGVFRLRFRPATKDVGQGIHLEKTRVNYWENILKSISH